MEFDLIWLDSSGGISKTRSENDLICCSYIYQVKIYSVLRYFFSNC